MLWALIEVCADLVGDLKEADLEGRGGALLEEAGLALCAARTGGLLEPDLGRVRAVANRLGLAEADGG